MTADWQEEAAILSASGFVDEPWYLAQYADVRLLGMGAAEHYIKYGAAIGRNPSEIFDTRFYLETYTDVAHSDINPLLHYVLHGREEGRYGRAEDMSDPFRRIREASRRLKVMGFATRPIDDLKGIIAETDDAAARSLAHTEIALWHLHKAVGPEDYTASLAHLEQAAMPAGTDEAHHSRLILLRLLCHYHLQQVDQARDLFDEATTLGLDSPDVCLARANFETSAKNQLTFINRALSKSNIPEIGQRRGVGTPYDRLTITKRLPTVPAEGQPKISVLIAAYNAEKTLSTALRSLQEQSWQNLEIIVIDDASTDKTAGIAARFAKEDPRITLLSMDKNGGAYVARNAGLDLATGEYITLHDADDWSHPLKLEIQARHLSTDPTLIGCTSQQARASADLKFVRCTDDGRLVFPNTSSLMFRRIPMREACGYWDRVRFSADNELIRRIRKIFGHQAVRHLPTGPLSFQRDSGSSIVAHPFFGINGSPKGIRHEYFEAQHFHHKHALSLRYSNSPEVRPFAAPVAMWRKPAPQRHFDIILAADFRQNTPIIEGAIKDITQLKAAGLSIGLVQMYDYDSDPNPHRVIIDEVRTQIDSKQLQLLTYGEHATCDQIHILDTNVLHELQTFLPDINAQQVEIIADADTHDLVYRTRCDKHARHYFGKDTVWTSKKSITACIQHFYKQRRMRLARLFDPVAQKSIFFKKLSSELLPAINDDLSSTLRLSQDVLQKMATDTESIAPLVSIIMPTFNRGEIIADAIQSVRDQTHVNWELFVCDDASTDNTAAVVNGFSDARVHYISLEKAGAAAARNAGLKKARGAIIAYLDSDNYWHPDYLKAVVHTLGAHQDKLAVYANYIDYQITKDHKVTIESYQRPAFDLNRLITKNYIDLNTFAHRRELYDAFGGFNPSLKRRQDYDLILKYSWLEDPVQIEEILALYQRNAQLTQITQAEGHDTSCVEIIDRSLDTYFRFGLPPPARVTDKVSIIIAGRGKDTALKAAVLAQALSQTYETRLMSSKAWPSEDTLSVTGYNLPLHDLSTCLPELKGQVILVMDMAEPILSPGHFLPVSVTDNNGEPLLQAALFTGSLYPESKTGLDPASPTGQIHPALYRQRYSHAAIRGRFDLFQHQTHPDDKRKIIRADTLFR